MKEKNKDYLKLNRSVFIAFAVDILVSAIVAQSLVEQQDYINSTLTLIVDHATFFPILVLDGLTIFEPGTILFDSLKPKAS